MPTRISESLLWALLSYICLIALASCQKGHGSAEQRENAPISQPQKGCPSTAASWASQRQQDPMQFYDCLNQCMIPLQQPLSEPSGNDWLAQHHERGQGFAEYQQSISPDSLTQPIYLKKVGFLDEASSRLLDTVGVYLAAFFQRPVKWTKPLSIASIPKSAQRRNPHRGHPQLQTMYLLNEVLRKEKPEDASAYLAFSSRDLYPSANWNYVFGQASLRSRVGVWSIYRFGDPSYSEETFRDCLLRAIKTATHEMGHIYRIEHCTAWHCNMNGSNHLRELDRAPVYYCPNDLAKASYRLNWEEEKRLSELLAFWKRQKGGYTKQVNYYRELKASLFTP